MLSFNEQLRRGMSEKFNQFVANQVRSSNVQEQAIDAEKEKEAWIGNINKLYSLVEESLREHIDAGHIRIVYTPINLSEELLGTYPVREASIALGNELVKLKPIGTYLIGARGRIDMIGPRGVTRFTIVPEDATAPRVRVTIVSEGEQPPAPDPIPPLDTWVWKIATPPPRITYIDLNVDTFREAFMGVISG